MNTDYVVRTWKQTTAGHARVTVVDMHGRVAHVTIAAAHHPIAYVDGLIRDRLAALGPPRRLPV